ncbi:EF-P 5-aminopentanol modification-associated protein YfmF [Alkalicoccus luteus]|uniref:EF-P 5-aminopentanol modification-associated protein YfmF n=1 Tax=Alkalicoccus luteus TaxID=1237094 RepID=UPI0040336806
MPEANKTKPVRTTVIPSITFKTTTFVLHLRTPLQKEYLTEKALLPSVLERGSRHFPSREIIQAALEEMYGAHLTADAVKKGEHHILSFKLEVANEKFLNEAVPLTERAVQMLASVALYPNLNEKGAFPDTPVQEEKRNHAQKLAGVKDDKMRYANKRLAEEMCEGEPYSLPVLGYEQQLEAITGKSLAEAHQALLKDSSIDLYVVGDVREQEIIQYVEQFMQFSSRPLAPLQTEFKKPEKVREVKETDEISQAKLHLGFRTPVVFGSKRYFALQVMNSLFGGAPHSKLFTNVREKESLAYYAASRVESHKGLVIVMAGIETAQYDKALSIILQQLDDLKNGEFSEEDVAKSKAVLRNQLLETMDSPRGRVELEYHGALIGEDWDAGSWITEIDKVQSADVKAAAASLELDTIYFLHGKG